MKHAWDKHAESIVIAVALALVAGYHEYLSRYASTHWIWLVKILFWGSIIFGTIATIDAYRSKCPRPLLWGLLAILLGGTVVPPALREIYLIPSLNQRRLDAIRARTYNAPEEDGVRWDPTNSSRIAFSTGGFLDNWTAYVYDPTGLVMKCEEYQGDWDKLHSEEFKEVRELFGGDLLWAEPIGHGWYRCGFT